ncbi:MAG: alpha-2-macroglobulin family protein [Bacteroidales bacterium]|nr:alpha-2-macroglobulin family protein [Bacteroidales bacterium]
MKLLSKLTATALTACTAVTAGAQLPLEPDFAHPQQVIAAARPVLADGSGIDRMQALLQTLYATAAIDPDSLFTAPARVEALIAKENQADIRGLLMLYEARLLSGIYQRQSYKYDRVDAPLSPLPENIEEWSGDQFRARISHLVEAALGDMSQSMGNRLRDYSLVIDADDASLRYYPTLGDFAWSSARSSLLTAGDPDGAEAVAAKALGAARQGSLFSAVAACWMSDGLEERYRENPRGEYGAYLLYNLQGCTDTYEYIDMLRSYLKDNDKNILTDALTARLRQLTDPTVSMLVPSTAAPGVEFAGIIKHDFTTRTGFNVYRVTNPEVTDQNKRRLVAVASLEIDTDSLRGNVTDTLHLTIDKPGIYTVKPTINGKENPERWQRADVCVTPYMPVIISDNGAETLILTDYLSGHPAKGVEARIRQVPGGANASTTARPVGTTDADGIVNFTLPPERRRSTNRYQLSLSKDGKIYYYPSGLDMYSYRNGVGEENYTGSIFIDRPLYHPGDSIEWSVAAIRSLPKDKANSPLADATIIVRLRDANHQIVDTAEVRTDSYGRCSGRFATKTDALTGNYGLQVEYRDRYVAWRNVMVSDYKVPVFEVKDLAVDADTITGRALTYSGMPVADADVNVVFSKYIWWGWRRNSGEQVGAASGKTDADGRFSILIPSDVIDAKADFDCAVNVTSSTGEYASASTVFAGGRPLHLVYRGDKDRFDTSGPVTLPVAALNADGKTKPLKVNWTLSARGLPEIKGSAEVDSTGLTIDAADVAAGTYTLSVMPVDSTLCDVAKDIATVYLYNVARNAVPADELIFLPVQSLTVRAGEKVSVTLGVADDSYVYVANPRGDGRFDVSVEHVSAGFHTIEVETSPDADSQTITLITNRNGKVATAMVGIKIDKGDKLTLTADSWRDRLVPGSDEQWTFTLARANGRPATGAMVATMYNHALDALNDLGWPAALDVWQNSLRLDTSTLPAGMSSFYYTLNSYRSRRADGLPASPVFRYVPEYRIMIRGTRYNAMAKSAAGVNIMAEDVAEFEAPMTEAAGAVLEESAVTSDADEMADDGGNGASAPDNGTPLREGEAVQAFWMPDLSVGTDGKVTVRFTVPDANTTWAFRAFAWDENLKSATAMRDIVANRPLMVQPNLPRFLREGDVAVLLATVYNNSAIADTVTSVIEIFDPVTGAVIDSKSDTDIIEAGRRAIVSMPVKAAIGSTMTGYRIRVRGSRHSDGEQDAIPVLSSGAVVVESDNFVLNDKNSRFETTLPADSSAVMALQYCQNPVWDVVRSLPYLLATGQNMSSGEAADAVYGALTARGLLKSYPEIKRVIDLWQANPADSALVSDLMKNEDIKLALLDQTPWVSAAASQTERMSRLAMTFDSKTIDKTLARGLSALEKLQGKDGGFAWGSWCDEPSLWATTMVLTTIGRLNANGYLPDDGRLKAIIDRAMRYCDSKVRDDDYGYVYMTSLYPDYKPTTVAARSAVNKAVQAIVKDWRDAPTAIKARYALILNANRNKAVAKEIMSSVREFAVETADGGLKFPSVSSVASYSTILEAFATIAPVKTDIDRMRQWLMMRSRVSDDLGTYDPTALISAILATGTVWTDIDNGTASVTIGGKDYKPDAIETASGEFSVRLSAADSGKALTVVRQAGGPVSYGSLTTVSTRLMTAVESRSCESLSIEKRLLAERDGAWVVTDSIRLGERVRVQLLIKANEDLDYVTVNDERAAALEPVDQLPGYVYASGIGFYRENGDSRTRLFVTRLPRGTYYLTYDMTASVAGSFASGIASAQSQYAPEVTAHSGGTTLSVE